MHDLLIKNGTIIDGTGEDMYVADLAVNDGIITEIGDLRGEKAQKEIDATDKYITPGFIDIANRSDVYWRLFRDPALEGLLFQGITTILCGHSGTSLAPIFNKQMFLSTQKWSDVRTVNVAWETMEEFLTTLERTHLSVHFATLVGHGTLRRGITADTVRPLTPKEILSLQKHVDNAITQGAFGMSVGLLYAHAQQTTPQELRAVAEVVEHHGALFAAHLRDEGAGLLESLDEILDTTSATNVRTQITHLKAIGTKNWFLMQEAIERIEKARAQGQAVLFDLYPYTHTGSVLYTFLPTWVTEGGKTMMLTRLRKPEIYNHVLEEMKKSDIDFSTARIAHTAHSTTLRGKTLGDIAHHQHVSIPKVIVDLLLASEGRVIVLLDALSEENVIRALTNPYAIVATNAPGYTITDDNVDTIVHPRAFGSFPRLLKRYVREQKIIPWELAIHKITGKPAKQIGLARRGLLTEGFYADLVVLDPLLVGDRADIKNPMRYANGIEHVYVNGVPVIDGGLATGIRPGTVLRNDQ